MIDRKNFNPDVLSLLANLSNDEVFTPPKLANEILDVLPQEIWRDKNAKFLDPCSKTGVFLREIAKRLLKGLETEIPDLHDRINHIFKNQIYGIAITELTAHLTRRSVYCSKHAAGKYSVCDAFDDDAGNIRFERIEHAWNGGKCAFCGTSQGNYNRGEEQETHAYEFIHTAKPEEIFKMKFDVIVGNPPYQMSDGGAQASAMPIYHKFVQQAKKMNPRYLVMIIPARWFAGGKGLDSFRDEMLKDNRIREIHDYIRADEVFPGVEIKGGVCYFLWDRDNRGLCKVHTHLTSGTISVSERPLLIENTDVFIRYAEAVQILQKIVTKKEKSFSDIVSVRKPFGFPTNFSAFKAENFEGAVKIYAYKKTGFIARKSVVINQEWIDKYKVLVPEAWGVGNLETDWIKPLIGDPNTCCTETYLLIGPFDNKQKAKNAVSYLQTKFFHLMLSLKKITQHSTQKVYQFIPIQDFSEAWTDEKLYAKYGLTPEEIAFIESMIRPMEVDNND